MEKKSHDQYILCLISGAEHEPEHEDDVDYFYQEYTEEKGTVLTDFPWSAHVFTNKSEAEDVKNAYKEQQNVIFEVHKLGQLLQPIDGQYILQVKDKEEFLVDCDYKTHKIQTTNDILDAAIFGNKETVEIIQKDLEANGTIFEVCDLKFMQKDVEQINSKQINSKPINAKQTKWKLNDNVGYALQRKGTTDFYLRHNDDTGRITTITDIRGALVFSDENEAKSLQEYFEQTGAYFKIVKAIRGKR